MPKPLIRPESYTYSDYYSWPDEIRGELLGGQFHVQEPAPAPRQQRVAAILWSQLDTFFFGKHCVPFLAPFDVRLPRPTDEDGMERDVVQPDIVICDRSKIDDRGCRGAPDWVVEVTSPGTRERDWTLKRALYERSGVPLYWIVSPNSRELNVLRLGTDRHYAAQQTSKALGKQAVVDYPGLTIDWDRVFASW